MRKLILALTCTCVMIPVAFAEVRVRVGPYVYSFPGPNVDLDFDRGGYPPQRTYRPWRNQRQWRPQRPRAQPRPRPQPRRQITRDPWQADVINPPRIAEYYSENPTGTVIVSTKRKKLYLILGQSSAWVYPIAVGKAGYAWKGREKVSAIRHWPDWYPPPEMRKRDPSLPKKVNGGAFNPLGAAAVYLGQTLYRIHGTNEPSKIGSSVTSGCIRMHNSHVRHLIKRIKIGTEVIVR